MEARHKTLDFIGRNACPGRRQVNSQFKQIVLNVNNFLIQGSLLMIREYKPIFTHFYKLRKWLTINDLRKHTNRLREGFTMW